MGTMYIDLHPSDVNTALLDEIIRRKFAKINSKRQFKESLYKHKLYEGKMKNGYRSIFFHEKFNRYIAILTNPCFPTMWPYRIVLHFSQWRNIYELIKGLKYLLGKALAKEVFFKGVLARLDVWVDLNIPYDNVKMFVYKPKISICEKFRKLRGTTYLGSFKSDCYDLIYEKVSEDDVFELEPKTRFERVFKGNRLPIKHLYQYPRLAKMDLFHSMYFEIPSFSNVRVLNDASVSDIVRGFYSAVMREGLYFARKRYSRDRAYYTKILPYWAANSTRFDLSKAWQTHMKDVLLQKTPFTNDEMEDNYIDPFTELLKELEKTESMFTNVNEGQIYEQ